MRITEQVQEVLVYAMRYAQGERHEYMTPEHLVYALTKNQQFCECFEECGGDIVLLRECLEEYFFKNINISKKKDPQTTQGFAQVLATAEAKAQSSEQNVVGVTHILAALFTLENSYAKYYLEMQSVTEGDFLVALCNFDENAGFQSNLEHPATQKEGSYTSSKWKQFVTCMNEEVAAMNPLIGRKDELDRTIQILCRKEKNNPIHVGEPGVGKTAITYGLAALINQCQVPKELEESRIFSMDLGGLMAGTQYRGDFEKRFKQIMDGLAKEKKPILYIDEIHNIVGAGSTGNSTLDIANMLKPYLSAGKIRFIGATTYEEYKKYFAKNKSLVRRFQTVDVKEPTVDEAITILKGIQPSYEAFHQVRYTKNAVEQAVILSKKYINDRYLPDKAIDLIDEAGSYCKLHNQNKEIPTISKKNIEDVLSKICQVPKQTVESDEIKKLATLEKRLKSKIFGQDEAVTQVVNAIKYSRAGLTLPEKPLGSLLFVGPTGVGKTELCKVLSKELGVSLIRFDMSEYTEKHTIAKLIGAPAGYVGYEEGGLLTDAIRKTPYSILLLDEIEKAHSDIYNVLLQVMDYATLSDNQGRKADFRNVLLIMTSNAGANLLGRPQMGFGEKNGNANAVDDAVKRTFQPEFRNRLSKIVVFHSMDKDMARKIVKSKLTELTDMLLAKKVVCNVSDDLVEFLLKKGITNEYGAREIDRVINFELKPLLVDELLFGKLKNGGQAKLTMVDEKPLLQIIHTDKVKS